MFQDSDTTLIVRFNALGVVVAYALLGLSLWLAPVNLATKGYWAIGVALLTLALVNYVKYRFDMRLREDRLQRLEQAKNDRILEEYVGDEAP